MKKDLEEIRLSAKANWLRMAVDVVQRFPTKDEAQQYLETMAKEAEEARDEYIKNSH